MIPDKEELQPSLTGLPFMRSGLVAADLFHLIRSQPGNDRGPRSRVQGVELVVNVLHDSLGFLAFSRSWKAAKAKSAAAPASSAALMIRVDEPMCVPSP